MVSFIVFAVVLPLVIFLYVLVYSGLYNRINFLSDGPWDCFLTWAIFGLMYLWKVWFPCFLYGLIVSIFGIRFGFWVALAITVISFLVWPAAIKIIRGGDEVYAKLCCLETYGVDWELKYYNAERINPKTLREKITRKIDNFLSIFDI